MNQSDEWERRAFREGRDCVKVQKLQRHLKPI